MGDGYLAWFAGSLLWPALAGLGDRWRGWRARACWPLSS